MFSSITLPARKNQSCQVIRVSPVHCLKVLQLSSDVNCHLMSLFYSKLKIIQLQATEESGQNLASFMPDP